MGSHENDNVGFQFRNDGIPDSPSSGMSTKPMSEKVSGVTMSSLSLLKPSNEANPFFNSNWDPLVSLSQSENFDGSSMIHHSGFSTLPYPIVMDNQGMHSTNTSHLARYNPSDPNFIDMVPKLSCFGSGNFSEMVGSFGLPDCTQIAKTGVPPNYAPNKEKVNERSSSVIIQSQDVGLGTSPDGKNRKRGFDSSANKNAETEHQMDGSAESCDDMKEPDEKKLKVEETINGGGQNKENGKQAKDSNNSGEASKENYIHVRARRGQATNSHSLAERVRREKISERMRLLQELVPGCNKITGKAVMLDEIINYVQSLQQQVEFLSMKLATVNPELNIDIERILSKDILNSRGGSNLFGFSPGITTSQPYPRGIFPGTLPTIPNTNPQFPLNQTALDNELQGFFHMGFDSNSGIDSLGPNGRLKPEL